MRDSMGVLQLHGAKVFGISTDSPASRKAFRAASNGNYPLLSDWNKTVCRRTACCTICGGDLLGVSKRSVFVLDKDGVVRYKWVTEDPKVPPDAKQVLEEVKKLTA